MEGRDNRCCALTKFRTRNGYGKRKEKLITTSNQDPVQCGPYMTRNLGAVAIDEEDNECT
jgi:hypothetical protein